MRTQREITLFNQLFDYYGNERDTWEAVKIAIYMNYTADQVKEIY
jgi:hypothetical protein